MEAAMIQCNIRAVSECLGTCSGMRAATAGEILPENSLGLAKYRRRRHEQQRRGTPGSPRPRSRTRQYESGQAYPTDWSPTLRGPCRFLHSRPLSNDGALHEISHQRDLVGIEL